MVVRILMGTVLGFLSGLGIGGGSLLILWLSLGLGIDAVTARGINLLFFLPAAVVSGLFRWKQGALPIKKALPAMLSGAVSAAVFSFLGSSVDANVLKKAFGVLLLITGAKELFHRDGR